MFFTSSADTMLLTKRNWPTLALPTWRILPVQMTDSAGLAFSSINAAVSGR